MKKLVIIGGVAGGASAAARARRLDEDAEIIMFERGDYVSFANCGLPYHISGEIKQRDALILQTPESFKARFNVDVRVQQEVLAIDPTCKTVTINNLATGEQYSESYDALVLSPGAAPITPPIPGLSTPVTFSLRNLADMDRILSVLDSQNPQHATVVGGGFIGLEMVEALHARGVEVSLIEMAPQVMNPIDFEMANMLHQELVSKEIDLKLNIGLTQVEQLDSALTLSLSDGSQLNTELLITAIGVQPEVKLALDAGLTVGELGGIKVNQQMQTSDASIYAVGDAVEEVDFLTGESQLIPLAGPANRQGRIAANNIFASTSQERESYNKTQGTAICRVFDLAVASTGLSEKRLTKLNVPFDKVYLHGPNHAGYFPGATPISLKLLFNKEDGKILGAQAVGRDGVDKRIDILSVAIRAGMSVYDLQDLELTYAPPFGSAKDLLNQAGFVASNWLKGETQLCHSEDIDKLTDEQLLLDVRNPAELTKVGMIEGAINIPVDQLRQRLDELPKDREILIFCMVGLRGHVAYKMLTNHGFKAKNLTGGFKTYQLVNAKF